jgi:hypothetical protein
LGALVTKDGVPIKLKEDSMRRGEGLLAEEVLPLKRRDSEEVLLTYSSPAVVPSRKQDFLKRDPHGHMTHDNIYQNVKRLHDF